MVRKASSKYKRRTRVGHGKGREACTRKDSICMLPDEILCHTVSFLPTKDAVRASILSKRWRHFWTSVTSIDIDDTYLLSGDQQRFYNHEMKDLFMGFVDRVLRLNDVSCLRNFRLNCGAVYDISRVSEWIGIVIPRNVEVLDLRFGFAFEVVFNFPSSFFTCRTLVFFKLNCYLQDVPASVSLPSLKILHAHHIVLFDDDSMKHILDGCPVLEELEIVTRDLGDYMETLSIRSSSLKSLKIDNRHISRNDVDLGIVVDTTNLERLDLNWDVTEQCDFYSLSSLDKVELDYCWNSPCSVDVYGNKSVEFLRKMSNAKNMCLYANIMLVLKKSDKKVELHREFRKPNCLMLHLEEIKLESFIGCVDEMKMVSYFLKSSTILKKMSIKSRYSGRKNEEILKQLLMFSRGSTACQIAFK